LKNFGNNMTEKHTYYGAYGDDRMLRDLRAEKTQDDKMIQDLRRQDQKQRDLHKISLEDQNDRRTKFKQGEENTATSDLTFKKGGMVKKSIDGCAVRGKTRAKLK